MRIVCTGIVRESGCMHCAGNAAYVAIRGTIAAIAIWWSGGVDGHFCLYELTLHFWMPHLSMTTIAISRRGTVPGG